jgi:hypothetical protein
LFITISVMHSAKDQPRTEPGFTNGPGLFKIRVRPAPIANQFRTETDFTNGHDPFKIRVQPAPTPVPIFA